MANVAEHLISTFEANGIERIWGIAGDSLNGFTDALQGSSIQWMNVRHEEAGAFAASAEAAMTGELAVTAGTAGPGNLHLDRKSTRLNSSHVAISYAVCCLK